MESSEVRRHLRELLERARRAATERRQKADAANRDFPVFLEKVAAPIVRQVAGALKAEGYPFAVFTPGGSVKLASERNAQDFIEIVLDTAGEEPIVAARVSRTRGRRVVEEERPIARGPVQDITEAQVLAFLTEALQPLLEK
jgi:hypothetical protein